jgi:hypothetical protein
MMGRSTLVERLQYSLGLFSGHFHVYGSGPVLTDWLYSFDPIINNLSEVDY